MVWQIQNHPGQENPRYQRGVEEHNEPRCKQGRRQEDPRPHDPRSCPEVLCAQLLYQKLLFLFLFFFKDDGICYHKRKTTKSLEGRRTVQMLSTGSVPCRLQRPDTSLRPRLCEESKGGFFSASVTS